MSPMLWDTQAKQGHKLHRLCPYQGSFPPQLPAYFLDQVPDAQVILDPFVGRGTVVLEAVLRDRLVHGLDVNPVALALSQVKLQCASRREVCEEIDALDLTGDAPDPPEDIEPFFHPETWRQVYCLREAQRSPTLTALTLGRLHGHSVGFFSTKTFNVISVHGASLRKSMVKHGTTSEKRDVRSILYGAAERFLPETEIQGRGDILPGDARQIPLPENSVDFVVTSPPFLDVIDYRDVNWLRLWFLDAQSPDTFVKGVEEYNQFLRQCLQELARVVKPSGHIVFEVGPVQRNHRLDNLVIAAAKGILHVEQVATQSFEGKGVAKISRAMSGGEETTTMENNCVVMRPSEEGSDLVLPVADLDDDPIGDLFGGF